MTKAKQGAVVIALASAVTAHGADLPSKKAPPPSVYAPEPVSTWTGLYGGLNLGYGFATNAGRIQSLRVENLVPTPFAEIFLLPGPKVSGVVGGGQLGYNQQFGRFVAGFETDFQGSGMSGSSIGNGVTVPGFNFPLYARASRAVYWFGTVRGRFGATLLDPNLLIYGTAGFAYGRVGYGQTFFDSDFDVGGKTLSSTRTGWTLGAGLEYALSQAWSAKAEYLFTDLGKPQNLNLAEIMPGVAAQPNVIKSFNVTPTRFHTLRVGVNYRFSSFNAAPFLLKYRWPL